jgi:hypothetical protein
MKPIILAAVALMSLTGAAAAQNPTQDHRMWAAEQMISRVATKMARSTAACKNSDMLEFRPKLSEVCVNAVTSAYPILNTIRQIAASGDDNEWAKIIGVVHKLEAEIEGPLNRLEQR